MVKNIQSNKQMTQKVQFSNKDKIIKNQKFQQNANQIQKKNNQVIQQQVKKYEAKQDEIESNDENEIKIDPQQQQLKIYKTEEIKQKVKDIQEEFKKKLKLGKNDKLKWNEHMSLISDQKVSTEKLDINNDIQLEVQFYNITLENVQLALKYLEQDNVPMKRPEDYFAEMFKTDKIMSKIRNRLVQQQVKIQNYEEKQQRVEQKKLSKFIKNKQNQDKSYEKRKNLHAITQWKSEIKEKGEKAHDLSDFILKQDLLANKSEKNNRGSVIQNQRQNQKQNGYNNYPKRFGKGIQKFGQKNQNSKNRPGKMKRQMMMNKKKSKMNNKKGGRRK